MLSRHAREDESRAGAISCPPSLDFNTCGMARSRRRLALRVEVLFYSQVRKQARAEDCLAIDVFSTRSERLGQRAKACIATLTVQVISSSVSGGSSPFISYLRFAIGIGFLSAVADRIGWWGPLGAPEVSWGDFQHFLTYTAKLNPWSPRSWIPAIGVTATAC